MLAQRSDLDEGTLEQLVSAAEREVRVCVAESTDRVDVLARFVRDPDHHVRAATPTRPSLLTAADLELLAADRVAQVRAVAAQSRRLSPETVTRLSADRSGNVRYFIFEVHPERVDLAEVMQHDKAPDIADLAWLRLPARLRTRSRR